MTQPPPRSTRTDTRFPRTTRCRSDARVDSHIKPGLGLWVRVTTEAWTTAGEVARDKAGFTFFDFLSAIDWLPSPYGRYEDSELDVPFPPPMPDRSEAVPGLTGGDTRFQVLEIGRAHV